MKAYKHFKFSGQLTAEQYIFFKRYGFIHFEQFASIEEVNGILDSIKSIEQEWIATEKQSVKGIPIKYGKDVDGNTIVHRYAFVSDFSPQVKAFAVSEKLKALLELMPDGARIALQEKDGVVLNHYVNVSGSQFFEMGWHTDSARDLFYGKKIQPMLNVGLYLDDSPAEKGGLRILPETHEQGLWSSLFKKKYFIDHKPDKNEVAVVAKAGDLVIHDGRLWHRVAQAHVEGEASRRRVMYIPVIVGKEQLKDENSKPPLYHKFSHLVGDSRKTKVKLNNRAVL